MFINECSKTLPLFIDSGLTVTEACKFILEHNLEYSLVTDPEGNVIGMINRVQLLEVMAQGLSLGTKIKDIITADSEAAQALAGIQCKPLPNVELSFEEQQYQDLQKAKKFIFHSEKMQELMKLVIHIAAVDTTVLIQGESGVGKELIADILHSYSKRKNGPFIKINCAAIPANLLESELFGYESGAFTGANKKGKAGMFELANGGVLFLDEIGDMPWELQVKLLRAIQEMEITRVGGTQPIKIDLRILAGANCSLKERVVSDRFRKDLYYRLNVVPLFIPPLRERPEDILALVKHFVEVYNQKHHLQKRLSTDVLQCFMQYNWPGNVRELENLIERLIVTTNQDTISISDLAAWSELITAQKEIDSELIPLQKALENTERKMLQKAFSIHNSTYAVARALGISQPTVVRKTAKYGILRKN